MYCVRNMIFQKSWVSYRVKRLLVGMEQCSVNKYNQEQVAGSLEICQKFFFHQWKACSWRWCAAFWRRAQQILILFIQCWCFSWHEQMSIKHACSIAPWVNVYFALSVCSSSKLTSCPIDNSSQYCWKYVDLDIPVNRLTSVSTSSDLLTAVYCVLGV